MSVLNGQRKFVEAVRPEHFDNSDFLSEQTLQCSPHLPTAHLCREGLRHSSEGSSCFKLTKLRTVGLPRFLESSWGDEDLNFGFEERPWLTQVSCWHPHPLIRSTHHTFLFCMQGRHSTWWSCWSENIVLAGSTFEATFCLVHGSGMLPLQATSCFLSLMAWSECASHEPGCKNVVSPKSVSMCSTSNFGSWRRMCCTMLEARQWSKPRCQMGLVRWLFNDKEHRWAATCKDASRPAPTRQKSPCLPNVSRRGRSSLVSFVNTTVIILLGLRSTTWFGNDIEAHELSHLLSVEMNASMCLKASWECWQSDAATHVAPRLALRKNLSMFTYQSWHSWASNAYWSCISWLSLRLIAAFELGTDGKCFWKDLRQVRKATGTPQRQIVAMRLMNQTLNCQTRWVLQQIV